MQLHASPSTMLTCLLFWGGGGVGRGGSWQVWNFLCNLGCPQTKRIKLPLPECLGLKALTTRPGPAFYFEAETFTEPQAHQLGWRNERFQYWAPIPSQHTVTKPGIRSSYKHAWEQCLALSMDDRLSTNWATSPAHLYS